MRSANSVGGLLDSISIPPRAEWFDVPDSMSRYLVVEDTRFWLDGVGNKVPSIISVSEVRNDGLLWELNHHAGASIREAVDEVLAGVGENVHVIRVPAIFMGSFDVDGSAVDSAFAFAPALANLQVAGGRAYLSRTYGPTDGNGNDVLQAGALLELPGVLQEIDGWDNYHRRIGHVHCFTYVIRAAFEFDWWARQPNG